MPRFCGFAFLRARYTPAYRAGVIFVGGALCRAFVVLRFCFTAREVNSRLQSCCYIGERGFMPRFAVFLYLCELNSRIKKNN